MAWATIATLTCVSLDVLATTKVVILDAPKGSAHSNEVSHILRNNCGGCAISERTFFDQNQNLDLQKLITELKSIRAPVQVVNLSWNLPYEAKFADVVVELDRITASGIFVVGAAGEAPEVGPAPRIEDSVLGHTKSVIIVAELDDTGKLPKWSYWGKRIDFKLSRVKSYKGSSFVAAKFSGLLSKELNTKIPLQISVSDIATEYKSNDR